MTGSAASGDPPDLHDAWLAELRHWWTRYNDEFLDESLRPPQFVLLDSESTLGSWNAETRCLGIAIQHVQRAPWTAVLETLRHEMAHQCVDELGPGHDRPHGQHFAQACARLRVTPAATAPRTPTDETTAEETPGAATPLRVRVLRRIEKLLSLADSPNEHEAQAAFAKAHRLMIEHQVEVRAAGSAEFASRDLGPVKGRHQAWEFVLANILDEFFLVETVWARSFDASRTQRGTVLRVYGDRDTNLDFAEYVYTFLARVLEELWTTYKRARNLRRNAERRPYYIGVLRGFRDKLRAQAEQMEQREGLVLAKDAELRAFFEYHNPYVRTERRGGVSESTALRDGEAAGRSLTIHKPVRGAARGGPRGLLESS